MEHNAEQIKSELEGLAKFRTCPEYIRNALALITSQEQRIKELTEENEAWQKQLISTEEQAGKAYYDLACEVENLRAENERLREKADRNLENLKAVLEERNESTIVADTVRKMQSELKKTFSALCKGEMGDLYRIIDQIAKEMLEDKPCT